MLDRPRHEAAIREIREAGARVRLIPHGDVSASLLAVTERSPVDLLWGIGGTPEGVISAAAIKCLGGQLLGRLWPRDEQERTAALEAGYDLERVLDRDDLVAGDDVFFSATGITDGDVLQGVRYPSPVAPPPNRSSRARARARCAVCERRTTAQSCARWPATGASGRSPQGWSGGWAPFAFGVVRACMRSRRVGGLFSASPRARRRTPIAGRPLLGLVCPCKLSNPRLRQVQPRERAQEAVWSRTRGGSPGWRCRRACRSLERDRRVEVGDFHLDVQARATRPA